MVPTLFRWFIFGNPFPVGRWLRQQGAGCRENIFNFFDDEHRIEGFLKLNDKSSAMSRFQGADCQYAFPSAKIARWDLELAFTGVFRFITQSVLIFMSLTSEEDRTDDDLIS